MGPLPIDVLSIFAYNDRIARLPDREFLYYMQSLDNEFLKKKEKEKIK